ncbi:patatin family protein [Cavenderia fasciculata]|uniref:Patatin family protein n=1 Tax=Cavenderia fasciculata TaxID=261658 RepID=F4PM47_CACFS|nr:patatin family protein [Cavenderia fasciculata]EGG22750.1 patatin family protein [Cavenderia fasciculata]|eukprot:XP_004360601.1 patatin family protein [Cavenderia fasciculata]
MDHPTNIDENNEAMLASSLENVNFDATKNNVNNTKNNNNGSDNNNELVIPRCTAKNCNEKITVYCEQCKSYYCNKHNANHLYVLAMRSHNRVDATEIVKFISKLKCNDHSKDVQIDHTSKYIYVCPITLQLKWGPKLCDVAKHSDKPYLQVSFIGPCGCGKSTMIRLLADDDDGVLPIPAIQGTLVSTSSDINAYHSRIDDEKDAFIYVDCEGTGGAMSNQMLLNSIDQYSQNIVQGDDGNLIPSGMTEQEKQSFFSARTPFVSYSFPRLLYLFSDVLVFMFAGEPRERDTVLKQLILYGSSASAGTVNHMFRPHLVIVFNHSKTHDGNDFDVDKVTKNYLESNSEQTNKLKSLYQSISIIHIPTANGTTMMKSIEQVGKLGEIIKEKVRINREYKLNNPEFTRSKVLSYFNRAMQDFNMDQNAKVDFFKLISMESETNSNASFIFKYVNLIADSKLLNSSAFDHLSFFLATTMIQIGIIAAYKKHCLRHGLIDQKIGTPDAKFTNQFEDIIKQVDHSMVEYMPCNSQHYSEHLKKKVFCEVRKKNHLDSDHECTEVAKLELTKEQASKLKSMGLQDGQPIKIKWEGRFEQDPLYKPLLETAQAILLSPKTENWESSHILKDIPFKLVCNACLLEFPSEVRSGCGHYVCRLCCQESPDYCPICKEKSLWKDKTIPDNSALRILCLEPGNLLKSTTQCTIINEIEQSLYSIPIAQLFDVISGIGCGAVIGLSFPCGFTIKECDRNWGIFRAGNNQPEYLKPKKKVDIVVSLGNGSITFENTSNPVVEEWNKHKKDLCPDSIKTMVRIDSVLPPTSFGYDTKKEIQTSMSNETLAYLATNEKAKQDLKQVVNTLLAQLFYVEQQTRMANSQTIRASIRSRLAVALPKEIIDQIKSSPSDCFSIESQQGLTEGQYQFHINEIQYEPTLIIPFTIENIENFNLQIN